MAEEIPLSETDGDTEEEEIYGGWVIHPFSRFRNNWLVLMVFATFINVLVIPASVSFLTEETHYHTSWIVFNVLMDSLFITDLVLNFNIGYSTDDDETIILDLKLIRMHYLKTWFCVDMLAVVPVDYCLLVLHAIMRLDLSLTGVAGLRMMRLIKLIRLLSLLRLFRLSRLMRYIHNWEEMHGWDIATLGSILKLIHLIVGIFLVCHWNACIQFLFAMLMDFPDNCWVVLDGLMDKPVWYQYTKSMLRSLCQMMALNYGSNTVPQGVLELFVTIFSMVVGAVLLALILARMVTLFKNETASEYVYHNKNKSMIEYMRQYHLRIELRERITKHLKTRYSGKWFDEETILNDLSEPIKWEIMHHKYANLVATTPMFKDMHPLLIDEILKVLVFELFDKDDVILRRGELCKSMYFIDKGVVEVETDNGIQVLSDGAYFGELNLVMGSGRTYTSAMALRLCKLYSLSSDDYRMVLECFQALLKE